MQFGNEKSISKYKVHQGVCGREVVICNDKLPALPWMDDSRAILSARSLQFKAVAYEKAYLFDRRELELRIQ